MITPNFKGVNEIVERTFHLIEELQEEINRLEQVCKQKQDYIDELLKHTHAIG